MYEMLAEDNRLMAIMTHLIEAMREELQRLYTSEQSNNPPRQTPEEVAEKFMDKNDDVISGTFSFTTKGWLSNLADEARALLDRAKETK